MSFPVNMTGTCRRDGRFGKMDYSFEQRGRRPIVIAAAVAGLGMLAFGLAHGAPWFFTAAVGLSSLIALAIILQNSHSGLRLEGDRLTLFKDRWQHVIDVRTIRRVRVSPAMEGQPSIWLELAQAADYRLPGYCFGSATELADAFRRRGIPVV